MTTHTYKPGDVAMLPNHGGVMAVRAPRDCGVAGHRTVNDHWHYLTNMGGETWDSNGGRDARPLVVIDPTDDKQVHRLADAFCHARWDGDECDPLTFSSMQAALREFANPKPPKPEEPTGLGAVVEDARGRRYTRYHATGKTLEPQPWALEVDDDVIEVRHHWDDIDVVRVLSEGVLS